MKTLVSLGGNAILQHAQKGTADEQETNLQNTARHLVKLLRQGEQIAITHGNGPQVGNILLQNELSKDSLPPMPLDVCGAESQGMIGYMLERALRSEMDLAGMSLPISTLVTQTIVDAHDPAFQNPTKPVGPFYTEQQASELEKSKGWHLVSDSGRGFRRVVPSPTPIDILERETILRLFNNGTIVISGGGGGVPIAKDPNGQIRGVEAVLDKDRTASLLGRILGVDTLLILTDVDRVFINYGKPSQKALDKITLEECKRHLAQGQFPPGSMGPKIESAISFLSDTHGKKVVIARLENAEEALMGTAGSTITN